MGYVIAVTVGVVIGVIGVWLYFVLGKTFQ